jgi:prepilin-type N-terminal cleavage/methylation domain-containing protein
MRTNCPTRAPARRGFTLIELMVVIAIISVLLSLSAAAYFKAREAQMRRNTEQAIIRLDGALDQQWRRVIDTAKSESVSSAATNLSGGDERRARVIHVLLCLKREFPQSFAEARSPAPGFGPNPSYVRALAGARPGHNESSVCLLMALKQSRRGGDFDPDTALSSLELTDPVGDGVKEVFDGWGRPITFIRWPSDLAALNPSGPQPFNAREPGDKEDPEGLLTDAAWQNQFGRSFQQYVGYPLGGAVKQYQLTPVIASQGSNPRDPRVALYNFQLSPLGGKAR